MITSNFQVWNAADLQDFQKWVAFWEAWQEREVYGHPNYVKLYADGKNSYAFGAVWKSTDVYVLYPFILRDLSVEPFWSPEVGSAADIITPYGYGGPFVWGEGDIEGTINQFWANFDAWATQQNLVCEFVRFTLFRDTKLKYPGEQQEKLQNVVRSLESDQDLLWMDFKHKVRKNVNKARNSAVYVELDPIGEKIDDFLHLYQHTMQRRDASVGYYFPRTYFEQIHQDLPGQFMYFHAIHDRKVISTELVLVSANNVYSFLGGTDSSSFDLRPNDLLKYEIILWAKKQGKNRFVLGGGYEVGDGIYQYKLGFAPGGVMPFFVGYRVFRTDLYNKLIENKKALAEAAGGEWVSQPAYFPAYRA